MKGVVVDIGNARLKWAQVEDGRLLEPGHALHVQSPERAFGALADALPARAERVVASNVAGEVLAAEFVKLALERWGIEPEFVMPTPSAHGVRCAYAEPARLGADRWVTLIAARRLTPKPVCIVDAGTAVTFDALADDGRHLGGLIMAGPRVVASALNVSTRQIGPTEYRPGRPAGLELLGCTTADAVAHGTLLALGAAVDRAVAAVRDTLGHPPRALLSGGDGPLLEPWLETPVEYRADLVLEGLAVIAAQRD